MAAMPHLALGGDLRVSGPTGLLYSAHNDDYTVRAETGRSVAEPLRVSHPGRCRHIAERLDGLFRFQRQGGAGDRKNNGAFTKAQILPLRPGIPVGRNGALLHITLERPERSRSSSMAIGCTTCMSWPAPCRPPRPEGDNVIYFGPGLHTPPEGSNRFPVHSGDRIYLAGGAVLRGSFALDHVRDVKISGRGLLYNPGSPIDLDGASGIDIRDLIVVNDEHTEAARVINIRNSQRVAVHDLAGFTAGKWSDGLNISTSRHVRVDGGYLRVSDDGVVVYATTDCPICAAHPIAPVGPPGAAQPADTFDIKASNLTIWNDVAHALFVGHFGDADAPRTISDVR
jgi:hypothetical protein